MANQIRLVLDKVLKLGFLLTLVITCLGSIAGFLLAGISGVLASLVGSLTAFVFMGLTTLSVSLGSRSGSGALMAIVLGGWLVKMVLFMVLFGYLQEADWLTSSARPIVFFTLVAAVIGGLTLDAWAVAKSRIGLEVKLP